MNIKQRLNSLEIALTPRQYETKFIRTTICGYDSDSVTGYSANGITIKRNENESLDDFDARAKACFSLSDNHNGKGIFFIRSLYIDDNNDNTTGG